MEKLFQFNWHDLFVPSGSILEIIVRGTLTYLALFFFLRIFRRNSGRIGIADVLVVVVIADAAQNAMAGEYKSITEGVALVATIVFWDFALDWLEYNVPALERLLRPKALLLIKDGKLLRKNMRQEMITIEELKSLLREEGVEEFREVKKCYLEGDGEISVIKEDKESENQKSKRNQ